MACGVCAATGSTADSTASSGMKIPLSIEAGERRERGERSFVFMTFTNVGPSDATLNNNTLRVQLPLPEPVAASAEWVRTKGATCAMPSLRRPLGGALTFGRPELS